MNPLLIIVAFFAILFLLMLLGIPISISLGVSGLIISLMGGAKITLIFTTFFEAFNSFALIAIFLFSLMGILFQKTGLATLLIDAIEPIVGRVRGGLALVDIISSALFGTLTGSANATAATFSRLLGPEMIKRGYPKNFVTAVIASSALLGAFIPPSTPGLIVAVTTNTSVVTTFMIGAAIGFMVISALSMVVLIIAYKNNYGGVEKKYTAREIVLKIIKALPLMVPPIVLLGGIYFGVFSVTEGGVAGCLATIVLAIAYRRLSLKILYESLIEASTLTGVIMFLIATSYLISIPMSLTGLNNAIINWLISIAKTSSPYISLLVIGIILLILGCFIDTLPLIIAFAPLSVAALTPLGISPYHINALFLVGNLVGTITPPVGSVLFTTLYGMNEKLENVFKPVLPFVIAYTIIYFIIILVPDTYLWLPRLLHLPV